MRLTRDAEQSLGGGVCCLAIIEQRANTVLTKVGLHRRDVGRARLGVVHHRLLEPLVAHRQAKRDRHVAKDRLGRGDGLPADMLAERRDQRIDRGEGMQKRVPPLRVFRRMGRIGRRQRRRERSRIGRHRGRVVPDVRVVAGLVASQVGDRNRDAGRPWARGQQAIHPGVIIHAILDHDRGGGNRACDRRARLEQMRVLVGIAQDALDRRIRPGNLGGDVAVEIFGRNDPQLVGGEGGKGGEQEYDTENVAHPAML